MKTGYCKTLWSGGPKSWLIRMQMYMYFSAYNFGETKTAQFENSSNYK